nr:MAG TPA: hypothetical protein [Caudoviricetes sp.]
MFLFRFVLKISADISGLRISRRKRGGRVWKISIKLRQF